MRSSCSRHTGVTADFEDFSALSIGDWVGATGRVVRTRKGELSVLVRDWELLAEALRVSVTSGTASPTSRRAAPARGRPVGNERTRELLGVRSEVVSPLRRRL